MTFNSLAFVGFFAIVLALHALPFPWRVRKLNLFLASCVFYAAWQPSLLLLLLSTTAFAFAIAIAIDRVESKPRRRALLYLALLGNFGALVVFKYAPFLIENLTLLFGFFRIPLHFDPPDLLLPLGISFYTFHVASYLLDVYYRRVKASRSPIDFALYVTFFPGYRGTHRPLEGVPAAVRKADRGHWTWHWLGNVPFRLRALPQVCRG